ARAGRALPHLGGHSALGPSGAGRLCAVRVAGRLASAGPPRGAAGAEALRAGGHAGTSTRLGDAPHGPSHRPPLAQGWRAGEMQAAQLGMRAPEMLAKKGIVLRTGVSVSAIDRAARCVHLADCTCEPYDALVLATGATP
ncbi:FAD-dependent oxidoreductase, partial [Rubrivivax albus]|uniref:FAD-dependent oxidoreductase n=1 Tax=Rubrivivax albus TaxID=2499835 RepID=UPI0018EE4D2C